MDRPLPFSCPKLANRPNVPKFKVLYDTTGLIFSRNILRMNFKHSCRQRARTPSHLLSAHYCLLPLTRKSIFRWCTNPTGNFHAGRCGGRSHTELTVTRGIGIGKLAGSGRAEPEARRPPRPACDPPPLSNSWPPSTWSAMGDGDERRDSQRRRRL